MFVLDFVVYVLFNVCLACIWDLSYRLAKSVTWVKLELLSSRRDIRTLVYYTMFSKERRRVMIKEFSTIACSNYFGKTPKLSMYILNEVTYIVWYMSFGRQTIGPCTLWMFINNSQNIGIINNRRGFISPHKLIWTKSKEWETIVLLFGKASLWHLANWQGLKMKLLKLNEL